MERFCEACNGKVDVELGKPDLYEGDCDRTLEISIPVVCKRGHILGTATTQAELSW